MGCPLVGVQAAAFNGDPASLACDNMLLPVPIFLSVSVISCCFGLCVSGRSFLIQFEFCSEDSKERQVGSQQHQIASILIYFIASTEKVKRKQRAFPFILKYSSFPFSLVIKAHNA